VDGVTAPVCVSACLCQTSLRVRTGRQAQAGLFETFSSNDGAWGGKLFEKSFPPHAPLQKLLGC